MRYSPALLVSCLMSLGACAGPTAPITARSEPPNASVAETTGAEAPAPSDVAATTPQPAVATPCGEVQVTFAHGSAELDSAARAQLEHYASCVESEQARALYIVDSTVRSGSAAQSLALAHARGRAVADYLHGIGCHTELEIRTIGATHTSRHHRVWPDERAVVVSDVRMQLP